MLHGRRAQYEDRGQVRGHHAGSFADGWSQRGPTDVRRSQPGCARVRNSGQLPAVPNASHHRYVRDL